MRDVAANRVAKYINFRKTKRANKIRSAISHGFHGVGRFTAGPRHAGIVKQDNRAAPREAVGDGRVPVIHTGAIMRDQKQRDALFGPKLAIGKPDSGCFEIKSWGGDVI